MHIKMFKETLLHACKVCTKDKIEYLSEVSGRGYQWHRTYYSSVTDKSGRIISVMGRIYNINDEIIENSKRNGSLVVDSLTGAYIREEGYARIDKFLKENHNIESYLVMVDMDNFKMINDNFGHRTGDLVLKKLTQKVIELLDKNGIIIRFGGDEFIIFAHDITSGELYLRIETLRKYADDILEDGKVSAEFSVGITSCGNKTLTEMFDDADKRMYSEKNQKKQTVK